MGIKQEAKLRFAHYLTATEANPVHHTTVYIKRGFQHEKKMSVAIKASLYKTCLGDPVEIRRFSVDEVTAKSYAILLEQMAKRFPSVTALEGLTLAWIGEKNTLLQNSLPCKKNNKNI